MKRKEFAFAFILALSLSVVAGVNGVIASSATSFLPVAGVIISSPLNSTYRYSSLILNVSSSGIGSNSHMSMTYSLDGIYNGTISVAVKTREMSMIAYYVGTVALPKLPPGSHNLTVYSEYTISHTYYNETYPGNATVYFTIIDPTPPTISLLTENKTYSTQIPISFSVNETTSQISYSLDNQTNITLAGNTTLTGLTDGSHSIVVYANDTDGNMGKSDTVFFTVEPQPSPSASPTPTAKPETSPIPSETPRSSQTPSPSPPIGEPVFLLFIALAVTVVLITTVILAARKKR